MGTAATLLIVTIEYVSYLVGGFGGMFKNLSAFILVLWGFFNGQHCSAEPFHLADLYWGL